MSETRQNQKIFRQKTLDRISSPEQLTDYLRVTNPGIWAVLAAVILLLVGILAWSAVGVLETTAEVRVIVSDHEAQVFPAASDNIAEGMPLRVASEETSIASVSKDEYGRAVGAAEIALPDGSYDGIMVTEQVHPITFLLESR